MCGYRLWLINTYTIPLNLNLFLRIFAMNYNNNTPSAVSNMKKIAVSLAMFYSILNPDTTLAQNNNNPELDKQTEQCFKELRVCLETSPDTLKASCFNLLGFPWSPAQEALLQKSPQEILGYNKAKMKKLPHDETIVMYKEIQLLFERAKEMEKSELSKDRRDLLLQIQDMWGEQILTEEILKEKIAAFKAYKE